MTITEYEKAVRLTDDLGRNDREWFPKWIRRYALAFPARAGGNLPVNRHAVIEFSKSLLVNGAPAWQRWQAVRAIESYRNFVLNRSEPDLTDVVQTLAKLARKERNLPLDTPLTQLGTGSEVSQRLSRCWLEVGVSRAAATA